MQGESLESWLGAEDSKTPTTILEQAEEAMQWAVKHRIERCRQDFESKYQDPKKRAQILEDTMQFRYWEWPFTRMAGEGIDKAECPACKATGMRSGSL